VLCGIAEREGDVAKAFAALERLRSTRAASGICRCSGYSSRCSPGQPADAEGLSRGPRAAENGWSLFGLAESLREQGKPDFEIRTRFGTAWAAADVKLEKPRF
jgi:hypothetical protein